MSTIFGPHQPNRFGHSNICEIFAEVVSRHSANDAIVADYARFTFEELAGRVESLAYHLRQAGVTAGQAVMLQLPPGPEFIAAALSTMSLGAVFTPLAIDEPQERADHMSRKVGATHLLTLDKRSAARFREVGITRLAGSDTLYPDATAYILHTSGTTGMPKGAILPVTALTNCLDWHIDFLQFSSADRISHLSRPTFDFSVPELFLPVVTGGAMVVPDRPIGENLPLVVDQLTRHETSIIQMVPTILGRFLRLADAAPHLVRGLQQSLRHMVCNGEALTDPLRKAFYRLFPDAVLHNCYGPTEACVAVTSYICPKDEGTLPIYMGSPAPNVVLHFLREDGEPATDGDNAELWIGGAQNSIGYANDESQTREKFQEVRIGETHMRLYRTGDWVTLDKGRLHFAGRRDSQVKYKGVRIELGEIQNVIEGSGLCVDAHILLSEGRLRSDGTTEQVLACFVTPKKADLNALKFYAEKNLPFDRRPDVFRSMEEFPATANGKLDTRALLQRLAWKDLNADAPVQVLPADPLADVAINCLLQCLEEVAGRAIEPHERGADIGLDSLSLMELHIGLARRGFEMDLETPPLDELPVREWVTHLQPIESSKTAARPKSADDDAKLAVDLEDFFRRVKQRAPEVVVLHTSFTDFRGFDARGLTDHLLAEINSLSQHCTVAVPSFTPSFTRTRRYHHIDSKSETGVLGSELQKRLGGLRTRHPVYSFTLLGPRARDYAEIDWWRSEPFGRGSFFEELSGCRSLIAMVGTYSLAHPHRCEHRAAVPYFHNRIAIGDMVFGSAEIRAGTRVYARDFIGSEEEFVLAQDVPATMDIIDRHLERVAVGPSHAAMIWVEDLERVLVTALKADPLRLLQRDRADGLRAWSEIYTGTD